MTVMGTPISQDAPAQSKGAASGSVAEAEAEAAAHRVNVAYSQAQEMHMPVRQAVKEDSRVASAQVMNTHVRTDFAKATVHHGVTFDKVERLRREIQKEEGKVEQARRLFRWSWYLLPFSLLAAACTCGNFFAPTYFKTRKRSCQQKIEVIENQLLHITRVQSISSEYTLSDTTHTRDNDFRGTPDEQVAVFLNTAPAAQNVQTVFVAAPRAGS